MKKIQIGVVGDSQDSPLIGEAATVVARRGAVLLVLNNPFGEAVIGAASKIQTMRYFSFEHPKGGGGLEIRARLPTELQAIEALCSSADGVVILGEAPLAEAIARKANKPVVKPRKVGECLSDAGDLLNRILSNSLRQ